MKRKLLTFFLDIPWYWKIVFFIVILCNFLLIYRGISTQLLFTYDQARDGYESYTLWHDHHIKILGPSSDIPGVFHGALWYYILAIPYFLGGGNVLFTSWFICLCILLSVPLCGYLVHSLFQNKYLSLISMMIYSSSPLYLILARWLSNPIIALPAIPVLLLLLWRYIGKPKNGTIFFIGSLYGLLIQANFSFGLLLVSSLLYVVAYKPTVSVKAFCFFIGGFLISISTYLLAEVKFHGRATKSIIEFLHTHSSSSHTNIVSVVVHRLHDLFTMTIITQPFFLLPLLVLIPVLIFLRKKQVQKNSKPLIFLVIWFGQLFLFFLFQSGIVNSAFVFTPFILVTSILFGYVIFISFKDKRIVLFLTMAVVFFQLKTSYEWLQKEFNPLAVQQGMFYQQEEAIVDYAYEHAQKSQFTINAVSNPLYYSTTWSYVFEFYGKKKYGYMPYWGGKDQVGLLTSLRYETSKQERRFLILEPRGGIPEEYFRFIENEEDAYSKKTNTLQFGKFSIETRESLGK